MAFPSAASDRLEAQFIASLTSHPFGVKRLVRVGWQDAYCGRMANGQLVIYRLKVGGALHLTGA